MNGAGYTFMKKGHKFGGKSLEIFRKTQSSESDALLDVKYLHLVWLTG